MLSDVEGNNLMLIRLTPAATLDNRSNQTHHGMDPMPAKIALAFCGRMLNETADLFLHILQSSRI